MPAFLNTDPLALAALVGFVALILISLGVFAFLGVKIMSAPARK